MAGTLLDELFVKLSARPDLAGLRRFERAIDRAKAKLDAVSRGATLIGTAITGALVGSVASFAEFESQMSKIEGLVGISREQLTAWKDDIASIAADTGQAPQELAEALFFVTSAGLRGSVAMDVLRASAKASAAGLGEQKSIVDLVTSAVNAYGSENLSAQEATDTLTEAIRLGKLEPESMAGAMGRAIPQASKLGVKFSELTGLIAAMSRTGTDAQTGVTQISAVMSALIKPSKQAEDALGKVDLSMADLRKVAEGEEGLWGVLRMLNTAFGDNVEAMAEVFPNIRALRGVFDLLGPNIQENIDLLNEMEDSTGVLDEAFAAIKDDTKQNWRELRAVVKTAVNEIGASLGPAVNEWLAWAKDLVQRWNDLSPAFKAGVASVMLAGPALLFVGVAAKTASFALGGLLPVVNGMRSAMGLLAGIRMGGLITGLAGILPVLAPILPAIIAVVALAAIFIAAWKPISTFFAGLWGGLSDDAGRVSEAWTALMDELGPVGDGIKAIFGLVGDAWSAFVSLFDTDATETGRGWATAIVDGIVAVIDGVRDIVAWWKRMLATVKEIVADPWGWLKERLPNPFAWVGEKWQAMKDTLTPSPEFTDWLLKVIPAPFNWVSDNGKQ